MSNIAAEMPAFDAPDARLGYGLAARFGSADKAAAWIPALRPVIIGLDPIIQ
ncbi:hypothetical protein [Candidatus Spongiihabitans sp.]|uniref:hypothetical protein n=1 Tax=Candidatus Spongiihabitans sp. TaxID=3101308 RepID=UPI003C7AB8A8